MSLFMSLSKDLRKTHCKRRETTNLDFPRQSHLTNCCSQKQSWGERWVLLLCCHWIWQSLGPEHTSLIWPWLDVQARLCSGHAATMSPMSQNPALLPDKWWECWGREEVREVGMCIAFCQAPVRCQALGMQREVPIMPARSEGASEICWHL